jgi:hypothetical protein
VKGVQQYYYADSQNTAQRGSWPVEQIEDNKKRRKARGGK